SMRALKASLGIFSLLIFNLQSFAAENNLTVRSIIVEKYSSVLLTAHDSAVKEYQKHLNNPSALIAKLPKEEAQYLKKLMKHYKVTKLPKIKKTKLGHTLEVSGGKVTIPSTFLLDQKITFNGKIFKFNKKESFKKNSIRLQKFMGSKKTASLMNLIINEAHALGFLAIGALVLGTVALGAMVYSSAKKLIAGDNEDMKEFREGIKEKTKKCDSDLNNVEEHKGYFSNWDKAPGAFETFSNMRKVATQLEEHQNGKSDSKEKVQEQLYKDYGIDNMKNCSDFAKEFRRKLGVTGRRNETYAMIEGTEKNSKEVICAEVNEYIDCLSEFNKIHKGHVNQGDGYKEDIGVYYKSDAHKNTLSK
ncbi:MAG: hypothetical protein KC493_12240, partial [Bacteriovoracaceae bacterium]|nr:hypothetical protein [Bacteriovoracaceae bacterium]